MPLSTRTTSNRPITAAQQAFIAALATERRSDALRLSIERAAYGSLNSREASALIDTLNSLPRREAGRRERSEGDPITRPDSNVRAGRMLLAGGITATVTTPGGEHYTIEIGSRRRTGRGGWHNCAPTDEGARTNIRVLGQRVGWLNVVNGEWRVTLIGRSVAVKDAINVLLSYCAGRADETGQMGAYRVQVADRCGRCRRELTDPISIDRGIGPECYGRTTGSRHGAIDATATEQAWAAHDAAFAAREREQEERAFASDPDFQAHQQREATAEALEMAAEALTTPAPTASLSDLAASITSRPSLPAPNAAAVSRARDLIAEALDAALSDADRDYAMTIFDQLAGR